MSCHIMTEIITIDDVKQQYTGIIIIVIYVVCD